MTRCLLKTWIIIAAVSQAARGADVFVANIQNSTVSWYDTEAGAHKGAFVKQGAGGLAGPTGLSFGPEGDLYVSSSLTNQILRYDGKTGEFRSVAVEHEELAQPFSLIFDAEGRMLVSSKNRVLRFDRDGAFLGVSAEGGGLTQPIGLAIGPDEVLYVANSSGNNILRFDPETGKPLGEFAASPDLKFPSDLLFDGDGSVLVTSAFTSKVLRFDGKTGELVGVVATLPENGVPVGIARSLAEERVFIGDFTNGRLYGLDAASGELELISEKGFAGPENIAIRQN